MVMTDLNALMARARRTKLQNPFDSECSPEVYVNPDMAELAHEIARLHKAIRNYVDWWDNPSLMDGSDGDALLEVLRELTKKTSVCGTNTNGNQE